MHIRKRCFMCNFSLDSVVAIVAENEPLLIGSSSSYGVLLHLITMMILCQEIMHRQSTAPYKSVSI